MWYAAIAIVLFLFAFGDGNPLEGAVTILNEITGRGPRLTHAPADALGVVDQDPQALAEEAGLTLDQYALARMISSEEGQADPTTKAAIAWSCVNEASRRGTTIAQLLLHAKNPDHDGLFGSEEELDPSSPNYKGSDRYASSRFDPYTDDKTIAVGVLDGTIPDLTNGCQQFDRAALEKDPDRIAAKRMQAGAVLVNVPGVDPGLRFWRT